MIKLTRIERDGRYHGSRNSIIVVNENDIISITEVNVNADDAYWLQLNTDGRVSNITMRNGDSFFVLGRPDDILKQITEAHATNSEKENS